MTKLVAVVTGANKGIGFAIVKLLQQRGFPGDVILTSRDQDRGQNAVKELTEKFNVTPKYHQLDVNDTSSIQKLKEFLVSEYGGLDVLVNNAGMAYKHNSTAPFAEQAEETVKTNYFGVLNVSSILFPILRPGARVVHVSSSCGHLSKIPSSDLRARFLKSKTDLTIDELSDLMREFVAASKNGNQKELGWGESAYNVSKVGVSALAFIHQRSFDKDNREDLIVNAVHPGYVDTDLTSHKGPLTIDEGADAPAYLALLPPKDAKNPKGDYVWYTRVVTQWDSEKTPSG